MSTDCGPDPCSLTPPSAFAGVMVSFLLRGGTQVMWELNKDFHDPGPYEFQLEVGKTGNPAADDWEEVGFPVLDSFYAVDETQRLWGHALWSHYRVRLTTADGVYYSDPVAGLGVIGKRDWRLIREIVRKEILRGGLACPVGYLLKRKVAGEPCTRCLDLQTKEVTEPDCPVCLGTGWVGGYFAAMPCIYADFAVRAVRQDLHDVRGSIADTFVRARMIGAPLLHEEDIWVNKKTDERWFVHEIISVSEIRGVPLIVDAKLHLAPVSRAIYDIEIPDQLPEIA